MASCLNKCITYLDITLKWLEHNCDHAPNTVCGPKHRNNSESSSPAYIWEGTASDLTELAIAIHKAKLVRKPAGELLTYGEIIGGLQRMFGIKIPNIYSRKIRALERKKNASPLLERMLAVYKHEVEKMYM